MQRAAKWCLDRLGALVLLVLATPLLLVISLVLILGQGRPLLHREQRAGLRGAQFSILKFRTMLGRQEPHLAPVGDPRITAMGHALRHSRLDELPQLINVLQGDMSLVGPRPLPIRHAARLADAERDALLSLRPGITGASALAFLGEDAALAGREQAQAIYLEKLLPAKVAMELEYVANWSLWRDFGLLARTAIQLWSRKARRRSRERVLRLLAEH